MVGILTWLAAANVAAVTVPDLIARVKPSVVGVGTIQPTRRPPNSFRATAFIVADGRHALTNAHAIPAALNTRKKEYLAIFIPGTRQARAATVIAEDKEHDLALLRFEGAPLPALKLAGTRNVREGDDVLFTGFPIGAVLGLHPVTHRAMVAAISPVAIPQPTSKHLSAAIVKRLGKPYAVYQLDATAYPGNSGSPLYANDSAGVIGVINKVFVSGSKENALERPSGISYAIPIAHAINLLKRAGVRH